MKTALVVEGGGMRGAHTCGVLMALKDMGRDRFDVVTASSAGALTVAFFVARQFSCFPSVWVDHLHDGTFLNLKNAFKKGRHIMDIDYLVDTVFVTLVPLDIEAVQESPTRFFITVTDCLTGRPVYIDVKGSHLPTLLKATAALPFAYRSPIRIGGRRVIDGGISDSIPIRKALEEGCDDILLLSTRPRGYRKSPTRFGFLTDLFFGSYPHLCWALKNRYRIYNQAATWIERLEKEGRITVIQPEIPLPLTRLTSSQERLKRAVDLGYRNAQRVLEGRRKG